MIIFYVGVTLPENNNKIMIKWKLIFKQLNSYIEKQNILFQYHFGFRKGHSTVLAIAELTDTLRKAIDNNLYTWAIF